jgi:hypothetical protein
MAAAERFFDRRNCKELQTTPQNLANWIDDFRPIRESPQWLGNSSRTTFVSLANNIYFGWSSHTSRIDFECRRSTYRPRAGIEETARAEGQH